MSREQRRKRQDVTLEEGATLGKMSRHRSWLRSAWLGCVPSRVLVGTGTWRFISYPCRTWAAASFSGLQAHRDKIPLVPGSTPEQAQNVLSAGEEAVLMAAVQGWLWVSPWQLYPSYQHPKGSCNPQPGPEALPTISRTHRGSSGWNLVGARKRS